MLQFLIFLYPVRFYKWTVSLTFGERLVSKRRLESVQTVSFIYVAFGYVFMLSRCFLDCSVGVGVFVTGLSQISSFFSFILGECHCWWISESSRAHVAKVYNRLRLIRSVWRASKFSVFKIDWNCNFVGLLHHPFWLQLVLALFGHYLSIF